MARTQRTSFGQELYCHCGSLVISWTFTKYSVLVYKLRGPNRLNPHKTTLKKAVPSNYVIQDLLAEAQIVHPLLNDLEHLGEVSEPQFHHLRTGNNNMLQDYCKA